MRSFACLFLRFLLSRAFPSAIVSALRNLIPNNPQNLEYFFARAGPQWLEPLVRQQYFAVAPDTDVDPDGKAWRYPPWPPINYLKRMAASPVVVAAQAG